MTRNLLGLARPPQKMIDDKRAKRMERVDSLPEDWRELVHEYGYCIVDALRSVGIAKSKHGRHIVETVLNELSPTRGGFSNQGATKSRHDQLVFVSREPTEVMIRASMETISGFDVAVTKHEKHRLRLRAAIAAGAQR